LKFGLLLKT